MASVEADPGRFFDGDQAPGSEMCVVLWRVADVGAEQWKMVRRIGYVDRDHGELRVPADPTTFLTDLTSVPQVFTWLVPKTGTHLPAALLHDGLIRDPGETVPTHIGAPVTAIQADKVFRDAMADLGTPLIRRWLVWTAVSLASVRTVRPRSLGWLLYGTLAAVVVLGYLATLDLFDVVDVVPGMGRRPWWQELLVGAAEALVLPLLLALPWRIAHLYRAGVIAGWALALLFHVTLAVGAITLVYQVAEYRGSLLGRVRRRAHLPLVLAAAAAIAAAVIGTLWLRGRARP